MPPILVEHELQIARDPREVFAFLSDPLRLPAWTAGVKRARSTSPSGVTAAGAVYAVTGRLLGRSVTSTYELTACEPDTTFSARMVSPYFSLDQTYRLEGADGETAVTLRGEATILGKLRWLGPLVALALHRQVEADHRRLKAVLERPRRAGVATG